MNLLIFYTIYENKSQCSADAQVEASRFKILLIFFTGKQGKIKCKNYAFNLWSHLLNDKRKNCILSVFFIHKSCVLLQKFSEGTQSYLSECKSIEISFFHHHVPLGFCINWSHHFHQCNLVRADTPENSHDEGHMTLPLIINEAKHTFCIHVTDVPTLGLLNKCWKFKSHC